MRSLSELWKQRQRWQTGAYQRYLEHGLAVLAAPGVSIVRKFDMIVFFLNQCVRC